MNANFTNANFSGVVGLGTLLQSGQNITGANFHNTAVSAQYLLGRGFSTAMEVEVTF